MAAMTRLSLTLEPMGISHFHLFFLKPQNRFEPNLAEMFIGWSYTRFFVFGSDRKSNMATRAHNVFSLAEILKIFLSETTKQIEL